MFKEILKIIPKIENSDLNGMEQNLTRRFGRISKKFGKGLVTALAGGGLAGLALGAIDKILNPLKDTQEAIDKMLSRADSLATYAGEFQTTEGNLFKLQSMAEAKGLDSDTLYMLLNKYQTSVTEARQDPNKKTAVRGFTGYQDTAEGFFQFIQSMQKASKDDRVTAQTEIFGEKMTLKMSEFLQSDFATLIKDLRLLKASSYTGAIQKIGKQEDYAGILTARRNADDMMNKSGLITKSMMDSRDRQLRADLARENQNMANYQSLMSISIATNKMMGLMEKGIGEFAKAINKLGNLESMATKLVGARLFKGLLGGGDK